MRGDRLRDQPHPSSLLSGAAGVRPPEGTSPLQLRGTLPQIQTSLPLQGLSARPGGAVQGLSIMTGQVGQSQVNQTQLGRGKKDNGRQPQARTGVEP